MREKSNNQSESNIRQLSALIPHTFVCSKLEVHSFQSVQKKKLENTIAMLTYEKTLIFKNVLRRVEA